MSTPPTTRLTDPDRDKTREYLTDNCASFGSIPDALIVDCIMECTKDADFAVSDAALSALERRWDNATHDNLTVGTRPDNGAVLGLYTTAHRVEPPKSSPHARTPPAKKKSPTKTPRVVLANFRPYQTLVQDVFPLRGSCDCRDFITSSLGLCKHLLVVFSDVYSHKKTLASLTPQELARQRPTRVLLDWDPTLALTQKLDRLRGLRLTTPNNSSLDLLLDRAAGREVMRRFVGDKPTPKVLESLPRRREFLLAVKNAIASTPSRRPVLDSTPAVRVLVIEELERTERLLRNLSIAKSAPSKLRSLKRTLYPYQRTGIEQFFRQGRLLLADDMGLGKTTQAIATCHVLYKLNYVKRGLVIAPASLKSQWLREWRETTDVPATILDGTPAERIAMYKRFKDGFLILNYEQLIRDAAVIQALNPDMVVLDEAQRIKNYSTKSAVMVKSLRPEFRLVLTGTPLENRLEELASILDWVDDTALAPKWRLVPWHTVVDSDATQSGKTGARNLNTLRTRIESCVVRRVRRDVLKQLPTRTDTRVPVEMTQQQVDEHDALNAPIRKLLAIGNYRPLLQAEFLRLMSLLTRQRIISNGLGQVNFEELWPTYANARPDTALIEGLFSPKLQEFRRLIADLVLTQERKVVVFSQWRRMLRLAEWCVRDVLGDAKLRAVFFTGAERPSARTKSIVEFHDDPRTRVMFLSDAGGVGLNLQRAASACINLELPWNPAVLEQRIGRIYRIGQELPINVFNLVSETGIEAQIALGIGSKQALFKGIFDGTSDEVSFTGSASFLRTIESLITPEQIPVAPPPAAEFVEESPQSEPEPNEFFDGENEARLRNDATDDSALADTGTEPTSAPPETLTPAQAQADATEAVPAMTSASVAEASTADTTSTSRSAQAAGSPLVSAEASSHVPTEARDTFAASAATVFASLRVERTEAGGVRLEVPPEVAGPLLSLFAQLAAALVPKA